MILQGWYIATGSNERLHFTRGSNGHFSSGAPAFRSKGFNLLHDIHAFCHFPKDNVLAVQPRGDNGYDEELTSCEPDLWRTHESRQTCEPLVLGPALAIDRSPGLLCSNSKFSSIGAVENDQKRKTKTESAPANISPKIDFPPVPL